MALENGTYIDELIVTNPTGNDNRRQGDDHIRLIKSVLQNTLQGPELSPGVPGIGLSGAVIASHEDLNLTADPTNWFPTGGIIQWAGLIADIPDGWALCDGTGTAGGIAIPDLRNKFILGADADAGGTDDVGDIGGTRDNQAEVTGSTTLDVTQIPAHNHALRDGSGGDLTGTITNNSLSGQDNSAGFYQSTSLMENTGGGLGHTHTIASTTDDNLPPYLALAYIIKL